MVDDFRSRGGSPWGSPPGGSGNGSGRRGPTPPNIDEIIKNLQENYARKGTKKPLSLEKKNLL